MNKITKEIAEIISRFDEKESVLFHENLDIIVPLGFFRYQNSNQNLVDKWDDIKIKMIYRHKRLFFSIKIVDNSISQEVNIIQTKFSAKERISQYKFDSTLKLSLADSKKLLFFLMRYFRFFSLNFRTRLSR